LFGHNITEGPTGGSSLSEKYMSIMGLLIVITYGIYMYTTPDHVDGILFSTIVGVLALMAGIKIPGYFPKQ